jgi:hypothetical protein
MPFGGLISLSRRAAFSFQLMVACNFQVNRDSCRRIRKPTLDVEGGRFLRFGLFFPALIHLIGYRRRNVPR